MLKNTGFKHSNGKNKIVTDFPSERLTLSSLEYHMQNSVNGPPSFMPTYFNICKIMNSRFPSLSLQRTKDAADQLTDLLCQVCETQVYNKCCSTARKPGNGCLSVRFCALKRSVIKPATLHHLSPQAVHALSLFDYRSEPVLEISI